jgi:hypothetical protein
MVFGHPDRDPRPRFWTARIRPVRLGSAFDDAGRSLPNPPAGQLSSSLDRLAADLAEVERVRVERPPPTVIGVGGAGVMPKGSATFGEGVSFAAPFG